MKFTEEPISENYDVKRFVSQNKQWEWGICRMLFNAYRVNIGRVGQHIYLVSYFCKPTDSAIFWCGYLTGLMSNLNEQMTDRECYILFPVQTIKPLNDDKACQEQLLILGDLLRGEVIKPL